MAQKLRISGVVRESIVDGPGLRFVVFCQGCPHHCPGCHNPQTHDFAGGYDIDLDKIVNAVAENPLLQGVTFSGGEPFCQADAFAELARRLKAIPGMKLNIMSYSGWTYEQLCEKAKTDDGVRDLLALSDYLVDGPFILAERDLAMRYRGSRNQRYIDLARTRVAGKVVAAAEERKSARERYR